MLCSMQNMSKPAGIELRVSRGTAKLCPRCGKAHSRVTGGRLASYCAPCHAAYARTHRKAYGQLVREAQLKISARNRVSHRLRSGKLLPQPCERCGKEPAKPRLLHFMPIGRGEPDPVIWLCGACPPPTAQ